MLISQDGLLLGITCSSRNIRRSRRSRPLAQLALFGPNLLDTPSVAAGLVAVALCALVSLCGETFVHVALDIIATSNGFVQESLCVAFVESIHDLFAICMIGQSMAANMK
jgi:hypothetical protein